MGYRDNSLIGKIILKATITNKSPMVIASGKGDVVDFEVIRDNSGKPFIPAAGFAGMIRDSFIRFNQNTDRDVNNHLNYFWGCETKNSESQSHIIFDDLKLKGNCVVMQRDGVAIDEKTNQGITGSKFDYELVEPDAKFLLNAEITIRQDFDPDIFLQFLYYMAKKGENGEYQQGAFKSSGFGILNWTEIEIHRFDFPADGQNWFKYLETNKTDKKSIYPDLTQKLNWGNNKTLVINGKFSIRNSLIISMAGDETQSDKAPDKTQLKDSSENPILTGKSLKGAIRHRAIKILNTIGYSKVDLDQTIDNLFGFVDEKNKKASSSRIKSFETKVENANKSQIQPRIKIDRFTGGTIEHALMQSQPLWHNKESISLKFEIQDCTDAEAALMLFVMKDLFNEDLAIGGEKAIGRGTLKGIELNAKGTVSNKMIDLKFDKDGLIDKSKIEEVNNLGAQLIKTA